MKQNDQLCCAIPRNSCFFLVPSQPATSNNDSFLWGMPSQLKLFSSRKRMFSYLPKSKSVTINYNRVNHIVLLTYGTDWENIKRKYVVSWDTMSKNEQLRRKKGTRCFLLELLMIYDMKCLTEERELYIWVRFSARSSCW